MSIYGNSIFNKNKEESINEFNLSIKGTISTTLDVFTGFKIVFTILNLATIGVFKIIQIKNKKDSLNKVRIIEDWYQRNDANFIKYNELTSKTYSCKKFFDNEYILDKEIVSGSIGDLLKNKIYPDKAHLYLKNDKAVFTYYDCSEFELEQKDKYTEPGFLSIVLPVINADIVTPASPSIKEAYQFSISNFRFNLRKLNKLNLKKINNKFYFQLNDTSLEKYKYYYLSRVCLENDIMVKEAANWIEREYNTVKVHYKI